MLQRMDYQIENVIWLLWNSPCVYLSKYHCDEDDLYTAGSIPPQWCGLGGVRKWRQILPNPAKCREQEMEVYTSLNKTEGCCPSEVPSMDSVYKSLSQDSFNSSYFKGWMGYISKADLASLWLFDNKGKDLCISQKYFCWLFHMFLDYPWYSKQIPWTEPWQKLNPFWIYILLSYGFILVSFHNATQLIYNMRIIK